MGTGGTRRRTGGHRSRPARGRGQHADATASGPRVAWWPRGIGRARQLAHGIGRLGRTPAVHPSSHRFCWWRARPDVTRHVPRSIRCRYRCKVLLLRFCSAACWILCPLLRPLFLNFPFFFPSLIFSVPFTPFIFFRKKHELYLCFNASRLVLMWHHLLLDIVVFVSQLLLLLHLAVTGH